MKKRLFRFAKPYNVQEKLILRDHLALERTRLANERTLLTYIRSALYLIIAYWQLRKEINRMYKEATTE